VVDPVGRTAALRPVTRGQSTVDRIEITAGLKLGEQVITEGADRVKDGAKVALPSDKQPAAGAGERGKKKRPSAAPQ
jgi:multidrug efflux system membrane fusion protein